MAQHGFDRAKAPARYTELRRLVSAGADAEEDVKESIEDLEALALNNGWRFVWDEHTHAYTLEPLVVRSGECVECGRYVSQLSANGYCEGCIMQAAIDRMG